MAALIDAIVLAALMTCGMDFRTYDVTVCKHCGGAVKIIACIEDKLTVRKILAHVEGATSPPGQLPPARGPPERLGRSLRIITLTLL